MSIFNTDLSKIPADSYRVKANGDILRLDKPTTAKLAGYAWARESLYGVNNKELGNYLNNLNISEVSDKDLLEKNVQQLAENDQITAELATKLLYKIQSSKSAP